MTCREPQELHMSCTLPTSTSLLYPTIPSLPYKTIVLRPASNALDRNRYRRDGDDDTQERVMLNEDMVSSMIHYLP